MNTLYSSIERLNNELSKLLTQLDKTIAIRQQTAHNFQDTLLAMAANDGAITPDLTGDHDCKLNEKGFCDCKPE